jgi:protein-disulfide isomerase
MSDVSPPANAHATLVANLAIGLGLIGALCFLGYSTLRFERSRRPPADPVPTQVADWESISRARTLLGSPDTHAKPMSITVFSDYQCPFCAVLHDSLVSLEASRASAVSVRLRYLPLTAIHPFALDAALAPICAGQQGKFSEMPARLFSGQSQFGHVSFSAFAVQAGITDTSAYAKCVMAKSALAEVNADLAVAAHLHLTSTPSLLINDRLYRGAPRYITLEHIIDSILLQSTRR